MDTLVQSSHGWYGLTASLLLGEIHIPSPVSSDFLQVMRAFKNGRTAAQIKADRELIRKAREYLMPARTICHIP